MAMAMTVTMTEASALDRGLVGASQPGQVGARGMETIDATVGRGGGGVDGREMSRRSWLDEMGMRKWLVRVEEEEEDEEEGPVSTAGCPLPFAPHSELPDLAGLGGHRPMGGLGTRMCPRLISGPLNVVFGRVGVSESESENEDENEKEKESGLIHVGSLEISQSE
ncbi:hypothetical protein CDEST_13144 [Colletotrichum destructivum]|uniref:Uncharacterized protein n=1 Tax=Colletotrichum destructivum TaxID=34406 RepID=A0AAX4IY31_9PEZI|nr:hypothetical protein CDEST_13144 [Colletotrichum destructivum]